METMTRDLYLTKPEVLAKIVASLEVFRKPGTETFDVNGSEKMVLKSIAYLTGDSAPAKKAGYENKKYEFRFRGGVIGVTITDRNKTLWLR